MYGANVIIFEGILAFHNEDIRNLLDMKVGIFSLVTVILYRY
jgi:uridine kinase